MFIFAKLCWLYIHVTWFMRVAICGLHAISLDLYAKYIRPPLSKANLEAVPENTWAIVTGGSRGLGKAIVKELLKYNYNVIIGAISMQGDTEFDKNNKVLFKELDLSKQSSVRKFVDFVIDGNYNIGLVINNGKLDDLEIIQCKAGILSASEKNSVDGFETVIATNYLGHATLCILLLPHLEKSRTQSKIISVSSCVYSYGNANIDHLFYPPRYCSHYKQYVLSKLLLVLFTYKLQKFVQSKHKNIVCIACEPGLMCTNFFEREVYYLSWVRRLVELVLRDPSEAAVPLIDKILRINEPGNNFINSRGELEVTTSHTLDTQVQDRVWRDTMIVLNLAEEVGVL